MSSLVGNPEDRVYHNEAHLWWLLTDQSNQQIICFSHQGARKELIKTIFENNVTIIHISEAASFFVKNTGANQHRILTGLSVRSICTAEIVKYILFPYQHLYLRPKVTLHFFSTEYIYTWNIAISSELCPSLFHGKRRMQDNSFSSYPSFHVVICILFLFIYI